MIAGIYRLSQSDIEDLRTTIDKITISNPSFQQLKNSDIWIQCQDPQQVFQSEIQKKFAIVKNLTGITLSVLEDTQRLLEERQQLKQRSQELLQGLHFLELDYYQLREQNQKLKQTVADSQTRLQNFIIEKDLTIHKHQQIYFQLTKANQTLEKEVKSLKDEKTLPIQSPSEIFGSILQKNYSSFEKQVLDLKLQVHELTKRNKFLQNQNQTLLCNLEQAKIRIIDLETQADVQRQFQYKIQKMGISKPSSNSFSEKDSDSFCQIIKTNLKTELQSLKDYVENSKFVQQSERIFIFQNPSSQNSSQHKSRLEPYLPNLQLNGSIKYQLSSSSQVIHQNQATKNLEISQKSDQMIQNKQTSLEHNLSDLESREKYEINSSITKTQLVTTQLNKQTRQSLGTQKILKSVPSKNIQDQKKQLNNKKSRNSKILSRAKSFSKIPHLIRTASEEQSHMHLYSKYRGQLEDKYPNLKKFTNKVLQKKINIISQCTQKRKKAFEKKITEGPVRKKQQKIEHQQQSSKSRLD